MVKKAISELDDILLTQESSAVVPIEQNGATFKASVRPNPPRQVNVQSQAQLESEFGANIQIPDGEAVVIVADDSFALTKPIKIGDGSSLEFYASTPNTLITYSGTGAMFQNDNPANPINTLNIHDINFLADIPATKTLVDIIGASFFFITRCSISDFDELGTVESPSRIGIEFTGAFNTNKGLIVKNPGLVNINAAEIQNPSPSVGVTFISFILDSAASVTINALTARGFGTGDSLLFMDSNSPVGTGYVINGSSVNAGDFYQQGSSVTITVVANNGSGKIRCTATSHGLVDSQVATLGGFATQTTYNKTAKITFVDANTFDVEDIDFIADDDTGSVDGSSIDQKDNRVTARNNPGQPQSMAQAEGRTDTTIDFIPVDLVYNDMIDTVPTAGDFIEDVATERFSVDDQTGIITYTGVNPLSATISYDVTIMKSGGGGTSAAMISLFKDTIQQTKTEQQSTGYSTTISATVSFSGGLFIINPGDTFQLKVNPESADPITSSQQKILISQQ